MEKRTLEMALLLDFYGELLTEKQRSYMELYYNEDFSLTEIAKPGGITPQGVRDAILRGEATLLETEAKTGLMARSHQVADIAERIRQTLQSIEAQIARADLTSLFVEIYQELETLR